ncbi:Fur family transcriptional regulator, partial [Actinotalea sp. AC32]|nr:Fur family transcriptional regulator [Actinotalea sp. AC32]
MPAAPSSVERLRSAGLRVTSPRVAVLDVLGEALAAAEHHLPAAAVAERARARLGSLSTQAVYDCLDALVRAGLARAIEPAGLPTLYEARVGDNHHHLVCRGCGATTDVDCAVGAAPCLLPHGAPVGFVVDEAEVTFWGRCAACAAA